MIVEQVLYHLPYFQSIFALVILEIGSHKLLAQGCPGTVILLILASQVVRIIGMSHQCSA
jgi:hypothetical protein